MMLYEKNHGKRKRFQKHFSSIDTTFFDMNNFVYKVKLFSFSFSFKGLSKVKSFWK